MANRLVLHKLRHMARAKVHVFRRSKLRKSGIMETNLICPQNWPRVAPSLLAFKYEEIT